MVSVTPIKQSSFNYKILLKCLSQTSCSEPIIETFKEKLNKDYKTAMTFLIPSIP